MHKLCVKSFKNKKSLITKITVFLFESMHTQKHVEDISMRGENNNMKHINVSTSSNAENVISKALGLEAEYVNQLIQFGAVYCKKVGQMRPIRLNSNVLVDSGDYLRVHPSPRYYPICKRILWLDKIIYNGGNFIVLHKPSGIPSCPKLDNFKENCIIQTKIALQIPYLELPHRLDTDTSGILVIGKNKEFLSRFGKLLQSRKVRKKYKFLVTWLQNDKSFEASTALIPENTIENLLLKSSTWPKQFLPTFSASVSNQPGNAQVSTLTAIAILTLLLPLIFFFHV